MKQLFSHRFFGIMLAVTLGLATVATAQSPSILNHQGLLEDAEGVPLNGNFLLTFSLFDAETDGTELWSETQGLEVAEGLFHAVLGSTESLDGLSFDQPYWLGISVNSGPELEPRLPLAAVPYSLHARSVADSSLTPSQFDPSAGSDGQVLTIDGGAVVWQDPSVAETGIPGISADENAQFIGVNRETQIAPVEFFGIRAPVQTQYGGQYIETEGADAWPFYGYATNGQARAWHTFKGDSASWELFINNAERLRVSAEGNVRASGNITAAGLLESLGDGVKFPDGTVQTTAATASEGTPGLNAIERNDGNFLLLLNRTNRIGAEWFGVRAPVTSENQWGGMYMETNGEGITNTKPFYGYAHNNAVQGWHELDGNTNEWRLVIGANTRFKVAGDNGDVFADGTFNPNGADLAEAFDVEGPAAAYEPGDVLVISLDTDRTMARSTEAYSALVAGVYAVQPGVLLSERGIDGIAADQVPMGVVGVVPTKVTGEGGAIRRGDLLVTSSTSGHAMKADPKKLGFGMVLGKALEPFDGNGQGRIQVLVNVK